MPSRPIRIAYVINSLEGGGAASPVPAIVAVLREGGAEVRVLALTRRDGRALPAMEAAGLDVRVRAGGERDHLAAARWLSREVRAFGATHVWTSLTRATLLGQCVGLRHRLPVTSWQHNAFLKPANLRALQLMQPLTTLWVGDSDMVTRLTAERLRPPSGKLMQWPIFRADPQAPRAAPWRPGEPVRIGSLGRLHPAKGYDILIEALARLPADLPPFEVAIAGEGGLRTALAARIAARGLTNIRLVGFADDPARFLAGLHLYVQPSRREGLCIAAHEAMQAGLPVIASAVGQLPYSIADGRSGLTVPPLDIEALAGALATLLARPGALAAMGEAGRIDTLARFGPERFRAAGLAILDRLRAP